MSELEHVMQRVGRVVAADQQLEVEVRGDAAYATRGRVVLPAVECYAHLGANAERMLHGLCDHECGHASDTDFEAFERAASRGPAFKHLVNALEDGYIEARKGTEWRGCAENLARKNEWFWTRAAKDQQTVPQRISAATDLWAAFLLALTMCVRPFGGKRVADIAPLNADVHAMLVLCEDDIAEIATLTGIPRATSRTVEIAERIFTRFQQLAEEAKERPDDHKPKAGRQGDEGDGEGDPQPGSGSGESGPHQEPGGAPGEPSDGEGDEDGSGASGEDAGGDEDADGPDTGAPLALAALDLKRWSGEGGAPLTPEQAILVEVRAVFDMPDDVRPYIIFDPSIELHRDFASEDQSQHASAYRQFEAEASLATEALTMAFEAGLRAKREQRPVFGADEGFVDPVVLPEYGVGAVSPDRMYLQYVAEDDLKGVAVSILVDCSGSMGNGVSSGRPSKSYLARLAAIAMHQALRTVQIPHEVCGFTTARDGDASYHAYTRGGGFEEHAHAQFKLLRSRLIEAEKHGTDVFQFARSARSDEDAYSAKDTALLLPVHATFKHFDQEDGRGLCNIAGIAENLDGEAVLWQARRLAQRPERRRVMFVLSDGHPAGSRDNAQGARYLKEVVERVIEAGVEVYGIGIKSSAVKQFYPVSWVVNDVEDLARIAVDVMTDVIVTNRNEQQWIAPLG